MKKGSLQLSINAIVILILAITMLGLGLGFMRSVFTSATEEFTRVSGTVQKQLIEQMEAGDKIVDLDRPIIKVKRAKKDQIVIGLRNVQSDNRHFQIMVPEKTSLGGTGLCGGASDTLTIQYKQTSTEVIGGDVVVLPINVIIDSNAPEDTCFIDFTVCANGDDAFGSSPNDCDSDDEEKHVELTVDVEI